MNDTIKELKESQLTDELAEALIQINKKCIQYILDIAQEGPDNEKHAIFSLFLTADGQHTAPIVCGNPNKIFSMIASFLYMLHCEGKMDIIPFLKSIIEKAEQFKHAENIKVTH